MLMYLSAHPGSAHDAFQYFFSNTQGKVLNHLGEGGKNGGTRQVFYRAQKVLLTVFSHFSAPPSYN